MTAATVVTGEPTLSSSVTLTPRKAVPIKWWAGVGVVFVALFAYLLVSWLFVTGPGTTPTGSTPVPWGIHLWVVAWDIGFPLMLAGCVWFWIVRPWRTEGRISQDGLMCLALMTMYWQDMVPNMFKVTFVYNTDLLNWGSWANHIPGWALPNGQHFAEPLLYAWSSYIALVFPGMAIGCATMRAVRRRYPQLGTFGLVMACFGVLLAIDLFIEPLWLRQGLYTYASAIKSLTIFHGHYYQFPLYEALIWPTCWTMMACLRFFKDDKGRTIVERGVDRLTVGNKGKQGLRFLAFAGAFNLLLLCFYNGPMAVIGIRGDAWPKDIATRTYFQGGLCGEGTTYACPTERGVPIPHDNSAHIAPDGTLVVPDGVRLSGG